MNTKLSTNWETVGVYGWVLGIERRRILDLDFYEPNIEHDDLEAQNWETVGLGFGTNVGFPQIGHPTPTKTLLKLEAEN